MIETPVDRTWALIVEDDTELRRAIVDVVHDFAVETMEASNGVDALHLLRSGARPGLILLDLKMPAMSGWEFRAIQRHEQPLAEIPVVIVSGEANDFTTSFLDAVGFLHKPLGLIALDKLRTFLMNHCAAN